MLTLRQAAVQQPIAEGVLPVAGPSAAANYEITFWCSTVTLAPEIAPCS